MKTTIYHALTAVALTMLCSCNDYLDTTPSKGDNEVLNNSEQVEALFNNSDIFTAKAVMTVPESDDIGLTTDMFDAMGYAGENYLNGLSYDISGIENNVYGDPVWENEYNKVFTANLIMNNIEEVTDLTDAKRTEYLAQAHFLRAMAMWNLVNTYCEPYAEANLQKPGLPLKTSTSYEESLSRASLKDTYDFILADLTEALKTNCADVDKRWWVSKPAVEAMLARFYLFTQNYKSAAEYAAQALQSSATTLQDFNELSFSPSPLVSPDGVADTVKYSGLYSLSPNEMTVYPENYYSQYFNVESGLYLIPSESLIALYDHDNDLRYQQFFNRNALWEASISGFGDNIIYHKFHHYLNGDEIQSGPTVPEMLLTEAEALARQGEWQSAMTYVNKLREARMLKGAADINLTATSQQEAVTQILDERHREMPFVMRWFDIRRLAYNETTYDDVTVKRTFYAVANNVANTSVKYIYTLPVKSKRYAQPIVNSEITRSNGQIVQNDYDDTDVQKTAVTTDENQ